MTDLRTAAQQALEALEEWHGAYPHRVEEDDIEVAEALRAALAEPEGGGNLPPPLQEPKDFDHAIGADRFKVVRGAFWWHVLIGDSPTKHGKFHSRASAEKMAADLLREFRNGAFVQHEAALAEPQTWVCPDSAEHRYQKPGHCEDCGKTLVQVAEPVPDSKHATIAEWWADKQRSPLTEEEIYSLFRTVASPVMFARAIERAHGIT